MNDNLSIKVNIGGRIYPLTIPRNEEEYVRKAAKKINDSIAELQSSYAVNDKQDLLAMTALQMATDLVKKSGTAESGIAAEKLIALEEKIAHYLAN